MGATNQACALVACKLQLGLDCCRSFGHNNNTGRPSRPGARASPPAGRARRIHKSERVAIIELPAQTNKRLLSVAA